VMCLDIDTATFAFCAHCTSTAYCRSPFLHILFLRYCWHDKAERCIYHGLINCLQWSIYQNLDVSVVTINHWVTCLKII
jgi:hypothetical protein